MLYHSMKGGPVILWQRVLSYDERKSCHTMTVVQASLWAFGGIGMQCAITGGGEVICCLGLGVKVCKHIKASLSKECGFHS